MDDLHGAVARPVSEHLAFVRSARELESGHLLPVERSAESLEIVPRQSEQARGRSLDRSTWKTSPPLWTGRAGLEEAEFLTCWCSVPACGLLLDVSNLYANSRNHGGDPLEFLRKIPWIASVCARKAAASNTTESITIRTRLRFLRGLDLLEGTLRPVRAARVLFGARR